MTATIHHVHEADGITICVTSIRFHRNGVAGNSFYSVHFTTKDDDGVTRRLNAVVFGVNPEAPAKDTWHRHTAVIDAADPDAKWRGDEYANVLYDAVMRSDADRSAYQ